MLTRARFHPVYIPLFARTLLDNNYPLAGVMVGDPLIDFYDETVGVLLTARIYQFLSLQEVRPPSLGRLY